MTDAARIARCSYGGISAMAGGEPGFVVQCRCTECQRRTGSPFGVLAYFRRGDLTIEGAANAYTRKVADSERRVTDYFCPHCGGTVYCMIDLRPQHIGIAVENFADPGFAAPAPCMWTQHKHHWVSLLPDIPAFPRAATEQI